MDHRPANTLYDYMPDIYLGVKEPVILEIGAAKGEDTQKILKYTTPANYYAFEPDPRNLIELKKLPVNIIESAVGASDGECEFYLSSGTNPEHFYEHTYSNSIRKPKNTLVAFPWLKFEQTIKVKIITLKNFLKMTPIKTVDLMWVDAQGAESDIIIGAGEDINRVKFLYMEYNNGELYENQLNLTETLKLLPKCFKVVHIFYNDVLLENTHG